MAELELADTGICESGQGKTAFDPVMAEFCRSWKEACERTDKYYENNDSDCARLSINDFRGWMYGFRACLFVIEDYENAKIIGEAMDLWIYRSRLVWRHQIDELLNRAEA